MSQKMWDEKYNSVDYFYGKSPNNFLEENYLSIPKGNVLFLAEGEGRNSVFLASKGYDVTAVDISAIGLGKANKLASENNTEIRTVCADLDTFDLGESAWDGIVSIFCHLPPELRHELYKRVEKALKPTGVFLLEAYTPKQLEFKTGGPPVSEMMLTKNILLDELPKIEFSHLVELEREVIEGVGHHGLASVVQAIGTLK